MNFLIDNLNMSVDQLLNLRVEIDRALLLETGEHCGWIHRPYDIIECPICNEYLPNNLLEKNYCPVCGSYVGRK